MRTASPVCPPRTRRPSPALLVGAASLAVSLLAAAPARGQQPGGEDPGPWPPVSAGVRFGYDQSANGEVLGAQLRIPVLRSGALEVVPSGDVTFLSRLREYGLNVDAVHVRGGSRGGLFLGGGFALRNSIFGVDPGEERSNELGFGAVVGLKTGAAGGIGTQVEFRWIFLPGADYDPRAVTLGLNFPLWGRGDGD
jgi:hypothetical protein